MTPSGWHDDAKGRDTGHDEMQLQLYEYLKGLSRKPIEEDYDTYEREWIEIEWPFKVKGIPVAFADVCEIYKAAKTTHDGYYKFLYVAYEVKPKIFTVGGIIRQCRSLDAAISRSGPDRAHHRPKCNVVPVVYNDDPKLELLRRMYDGPILPLGRPTP